MAGVTSLTEINRVTGVDLTECRSNGNQQSGSTFSTLPTKVRTSAARKVKGEISSKNMALAKAQLRKQGITSPKCTKRAAAF
jgi:hypothetical protein